jgi:putative transposase
MAKDKRYAHMSIKSLMYFCQREGILYCGYDSWLKYIKINDVKRHKIKRSKKKSYREGIRAKKPYEIWHIDISEIKIFGDQKFYIQMIVDNYSRAIMSWRLSDHKDLYLSLRTIKTSLRQGTLPEYLMSDAGRENINNEVIKLLLGRGISQMIARADVQFSNSMIEAVFKKMKGVIDFKKIKTQLGLKRKIGWFVNQYNLVVPHSKLDGAIPLEKLNSQFKSHFFKQMVVDARVKLIRLRSLDYQKCRICYIK